MQYTTDYVVSTIHHQTELEFTRDLERRRIGHERAEEQRAASLAANATLIPYQQAPVKRMPFAGLVRRLRSAAHRELAHR